MRQPRHDYHLRITTNVFENQSMFDDFDGKENWRPKGNEDFIIRMNWEQRMVWNDYEEVIKTILEKVSNKGYRYELVKYEFADAEPIDLTEQFNEEVKKFLQ